jgi:hypothetical protein
MRPPRGSSRVKGFRDRPRAAGSERMFCVEQKMFIL